MQLRANIDGRRAVDIVVDNDTVTASIDGRQYELKVGKLDNGNALLFLSDRVFDCRILKAASVDKPYEVHIGHSRFELSISDPRALSASHSSEILAEGAASILAPMPGKVVKVLIARGDQVEADQGILIVEAMKMQNELRSPKSGIVGTLNVSEGATVNAGDVLAVIE